jgi:prepilin-type N-terminal cleavage/methylation domain-containing protein
MKKRAMKGFTLVELLVAISVGLLVMWAGVVVYQQAQSSSMYMAQHSVVQGNARTAVNEMGQDLNLAGYGLPIAGVVVPSAATFTCSNSSSASAYAYQCPTTRIAFPVVSGNATLSGIMPHYAQGATINGNVTDMISIAYVDSSSDFAVDNPSTAQGFDAYPLNSATVSGASSTLVFNAATTPAPNDPKWGFKPGDLLMVSNSNGEAVGEVTSVTATSVVLGGGDTMNMNQAFGTTGSVPNALGFGSGTGTYGATTGTVLPATTVYRVYVASYYAQTDPLAQAAGSTASPTRLYRVINGDSNNNAPVPVAEQISNLTFTYNLFNSVCGGGLLTNQESLTTAQIGLIKTVNAYVTAASTLNAATLTGQKIQQIPLSTSVSPRNLSFYDSYSSTSTGTC